MKEIYFVTGIDTDAGKSIATGYLAQQLMQSGKRVITQKLIQTGNTSMSEDIEVHRKMMGTGLLPEDVEHITCPFIFTHPCSPHLAAQIDQREIDINRINECTRILSDKYDVVLIEGAGGVMVPIKEDYLTIDFMEQQNYPVILVTSSKLGSLNHTLLTLEACKNRGLQIKSIIYNEFPIADPIIAADSYQYLERYIKENKMDTTLQRMPILDL